MKKILLSGFIQIVVFSLSMAQNPVLPLRKQAEIRDQILLERLAVVLPPLMKRTGIDFWIIAGREYNEDPVLRTMLPATWINARRRTVLILRYQGDDKPVEGIAVARYDVGSAFKKAWDPEKQPDQWARVAEIIAEKNPKKIGLNRSGNYALADGLTSTEYDGLLKALPKTLHSRLVSAEELSVGWLETRSPMEVALYETVVRISHEIISEAFSEKVITPGVTSTHDVQWFMREKSQQLGLPVWFHPTVDLQRAEETKTLYAFSSKPGDEIIQPGDLLHCDFGITYLGLNSDIQELAYVLKPGETDAPEFLKAALRKGNEAQDVLTAQFKTGKSGNQILADALAEGKKRGNKLVVYTHPIGFHGHAAGPTIGMWDNQNGIPGPGDYPLFPNTAYSIELYSAVFVEAWKKEIRIMLEEDAFFDGTSVRYIDKRQTELLVIPKRGQ